MTSRQERLAVFRQTAKRFRLTREGFQRLVERALADLPPQFARRVSNVAVVVEDAPTARKLTALGYDPDESLLGLYEGIPLGERSSGYHLAVPDRITIYRLAILEQCRTDEEVVREVRATVMHEIGHFFGLADADMD